VAVAYLEIADFLLIAEAVTGVPAEDLARSERTVHLAGSALAAPAAAYAAQEFYPDIATKATILCSRLARNHPLIDGNKRVAFLCMVEFLERNRRKLKLVGERDDNSMVDAVVALAAGEMSEAEFATFVGDRIT
jgi:death on curing protein